MADVSLSQLQSQAQDLFAEIQSKGINAADQKEIVAKSKQLLSLLDALQPHINKAQTAFGGQEINVQKINDLRNKLNRIVATYQ